jgi:hypothetical protein
VEVLIFCNGPACGRGVDRFRVYQGSGNNLVWTATDLAIRQVRIKLPANTTDIFFVRCVSRVGRESPKISVQASSDSDKYVVQGTSGETNGGGAPTGPEWHEEPSGGGRLRGAK